MDFAKADDVGVALVKGKGDGVMVIFDRFCAMRVGAFAVCFLLDVFFDSGGDGAGGNFYWLESKVGRIGD